jgi:tetratricopeptide (TPR) repeat protein
MSPRSRIALGLVAAFVAGAGVGGGAVGLGRVASRPTEHESLRVPEPGSAAYWEAVGSLYGGVESLNANRLDRARNLLEHATELAPGEPAAWANLGLTEGRLQDYHKAGAHLERARALAPESAAIERLLALLESRSGTGSVAHWRRAIELDPDDLESRYELAHELEREAGLEPRPESVDEPLRLMEEILSRSPYNLAVLIEKARLAAKRGDAKTLGGAIEHLGQVDFGGTARARAAGAALRGETDPKEISRRVMVLRNILVQDPNYQRDLGRVTSASYVLMGEPIQKVLRMARPNAPARKEGVG